MPTILHDIIVVSIENQWIPLLKKGAPLPCTSRIVIPVNETIRPGSNNTLLELPIIEADKPNDPSSRIIGKIEIGAGRSRSEIPLGSKIAISCTVQVQYLVDFNVYIPEINYGTKITWDLKGPDTSRSDLIQEHERLLLQFGSLRRLAEEGKNKGLSRQLTEIYEQEFRNLSNYFLKPDPWDLITCYTVSTLLKDLKCLLEDLNRQSDELMARSLIFEFYSKRPKKEHKS